MLALADVAVTVTDARASARWWKEKMGFDVHTVGPEGGHAIMVAPPGDRFVLHLCEGIESVEPGNSGIAFLSDQIEAQVRAMETGGVVFAQPLTKAAWGSHAKFADPDGNVFWLMEAPAAFIRRETRRRAGPTPMGRRARRAKRAARRKRT